MMNKTVDDLFPMIPPQVRDSESYRPVNMPTYNELVPEGDTGGFTREGGSSRNPLYSYTNGALPVFMTAYARVQLIEIIQRLESHGIKVYFTDTDTLVTSAPLPNDLVSEELGKFRLELEAEGGAAFISPQDYVIRVDDTHAKMVSPSLSSRYPETNTIEPSDVLMPDDQDLIEKMMKIAVDPQESKYHAFITGSTSDSLVYRPLTLEELERAGMKKTSFDEEAL
ncbi:hypothetical protein J8A68_000003 (mitochondrion) [[Candida] subhashii]|uniref:DNA-directed DNA polymerase n=1 Tax=[Candida] subhashii TaxID=561895 RepID=A0A8J5V5V0_9ASCO|nr:hypothetical protein J8A68_000003 [[Candida] subhashii]